MNLIFRLIVRLLWASFRARRDGTIGFLQEFRLTFRCLPTDLDVNWHMTNSRYFSFMDIVRVAMMIRNGAWAKLRANKLMPVLGSSSIRYRRAIRPFQAFEVTCRVLGWDDKWLYLEHKMEVSGELAAIAIMKAAFLSPSGRVATERLLEMVGFTAPAPPLPAPAIALQRLDESTQLRL